MYVYTGKKKFNAPLWRWYLSKIVKVIIIVVMAVLLTSTLSGENTGEEFGLVQTMLLKGSACLQKSYSQLFLLVNEIAIGETVGQVDFLTARSTIETIEITLGESRNYFSQAQNLLENSIPDPQESLAEFCRQKIGNISGILQYVDDFGKSLKVQKVPGKKLIHKMNDEYLECLKVDATAPMTNN